MKLVSDISGLREWRNSVSGSVGFVPTMGALHNGHLSLVESSNRTCKHTVVSIYVNPTQFSPNEDLSKYPRNLQADVKKLQHFNVDVLFFPDDKMMYPDGFSTSVSESQLSSKLEGASRPTHFAGVTTVVTKLFNLVEPTHAFFGKKDAQQFRIIRKIVDDLNFDISIIPCEIVRESHGLAHSSRNDYLSIDERKRAGIIHQALKEAEDILKKGERSSRVIRETIRQRISTDALSKIDYVSVADTHSLEEISGRIEKSILVSVAVYFSNVRLIDNFEFIIRE
ncbi:MAG: pantoate--beta-alanine ligase [Fidelibacterota bacterium]